MNTAERREVLHDQEGTLAMLSIRVWKKSPALAVWFRNASTLFEYLQAFDVQAAHMVCRSHLQARGDYEMVNVEEIKDLDVVTSDGSISCIRIWYNAIAYGLHKYFSNVAIYF